MGSIRKNTYYIIMFLDFLWLLILFFGSFKMMKTLIVFQKANLSLSSGIVLFKDKSRMLFQQTKNIFFRLRFGLTNAINDY